MPRISQLSMAASIPLLPTSNFDTSAPDNTFHMIKKDAVWKKYVDAARIFDEKMVEEWNRFLDVILVFIALFIGVLASFVIDTQKTFDLDPAKITNLLLKDIAKRLNTGSQEISTIPDKLDSDELHKAVVSNALLFVSLALSIAGAVIAMVAKLWLIRYISWVRAAGSWYKLAMQRQKAYSGIQKWKLHRVIDSLPIWIIIAVSLFGVYIHKTIKEHHPILGYIIGVILLIGLTFLVIVSCSAAFISSSPFQSSLSHFISWFVDKFFPKDWKSSLSKKFILIVVPSTGIAAGTIVLVANHGSIWQLLILLPIVGVFAVTAKPEEELESFEPPPLNNSDDSPGPWFGYPQMVVLAGFTVFIPVAVASFFTRDGASDPGKAQPFWTKNIVYIPTSSVAVGLLGLYSLLMNRINKRVQNGMLEAEAIAWLLESSQDPDPSLFEKAGSVATTPPRKALLLSETIISLLPHMIASRLGTTPGEHDNDSELRKLLSFLECSSNFNNTKANRFINQKLKNTAAIKHPKLPSALLKQLQVLSKNEGSHLGVTAKKILSREWEWEENEGSGLQSSVEEFVV